MKCNIVFVAVIFGLAGWPTESFAYIDPGTGSILIQGVIGAIAAIGVTLKLYWHRLAAFFKRDSTKNAAPIDSNAIDSNHSRTAGKNDDI